MSCADVVIKKRREDLKDEKELNHVKAKRGLDFLDLILLAKVSITRGICYRRTSPKQVLLCVLTFRMRTNSLCLTKTSTQRWDLS